MDSLGLIVLITQRQKVESCLLQVLGLETSVPEREMQLMGVT